MTKNQREFLGFPPPPGSSPGQALAPPCKGKGKVVAYLRAIRRLAVAVSRVLRPSAGQDSANPRRVWIPASAGMTSGLGGPVVPGLPSLRRRPGSRYVGTEHRDLATAIAVALAAILLAFTPCLAAPNFPQLTGQIVDNAGLLSAEDRAAIEADLKALEAKSTDQLVVVTLPSLDGYDIADYGYQLGRHWGIGQAGKDNGVLLIVAPNERKVRIEVGRGLEPVVTDLMSTLIIENAILPEFRRGNFGAGIRAGVRDIKDTLLGDAEAVKERARGLDRGDGPDWIGLLLIAFWIAIFVYIVYAQARYAAQAPQTVSRDGRRLRRGRARDDGFVIFPGGGSGSWGGGGWSGGGGGWSGGGGGFGGGGGSGSW
jgi:uncharacterized protein